MSLLLRKYTGDSLEISRVVNTALMAILGITSPGTHWNNLVYVLPGGTWSTPCFGSSAASSLSSLAWVPIFSIVMALPGGPFFLGGDEGTALTSGFLLHSLLLRPPRGGYQFLVPVVAT
ncbi:hypothetical protein FRX31_018653 [Thalictrum thalictroides]|uniref:Uncharacterized protein n=1 Tax=Thalictrum thalictroides TaxID=46969 RepID=A0A7J6W5E8_THATH|nr:hypothetical protein FRX31_018653 [Thalictrum thalictroides]